jgi:hypothetical protein
MKIQSNDRGTAQELIEVAIAIMIIGVILYAWVFAGSELEDTASDYLDDTVAVVNESWNTSSRDIYVSLDHNRMVTSGIVVSNASFLCTVTTDYLVNTSDGKILAVSTGSMEANKLFNISYSYYVRNSYGNISDTTGDMGEKGSSMLTIGIILLAIFAAVGFLVMPYIRRAM